MGILSWKFRIVLFLGSVVVFLLIARFVRKQRIQVKDGIFWILFSVILIIFSIFPRLAIWASYLTGVQSPANCVFMLIIFTLGCHQFFCAAFPCAGITSPVHREMSNKPVIHFFLICFSFLCFFIKARINIIYLFAGFLH